MILPLVWGVVTLIFILVELSPGSIADKFFTPETTPETRELILAKYQLDQPAFIRYLAMIKNLAFFEFGVSMSSERPVFDVLLDALPNTLLLSVVTLLVLYPTSIALGTIQAVRHGGPIDTGISVSSLFFYSMPSFWLAMMLQLIVAFYWSEWVEAKVAAGVVGPWFESWFSLPSSGMFDPVEYEYMTGGEQLHDRLKHLLLPGIAMGLASAAGTARYMRSSLLEVIRQDYIRTARAKGLRERVVILKHAMRNALLPIVTIIGMSVPFLFSGAVLTETIFAWPGMGRLVVQAIYEQDTPLIIAAFFVSTLLVAFGNLLADVSYAFIDPRIRYD
jgi:peptide/nickel transport system permease protein